MIDPLFISPASVSVTVKLNPFFLYRNERLRELED